MEKSKLGISIPLFSALLFFLGAAGGVLAVIIAVGYVLFLEENVNLKKTAVKALIIVITLGIVTILTNWFSASIAMVSTVILNNSRMFITLEIPNNNGFIMFLTNLQFISNYSYYIMRIIEALILVILGFRAYKQKEIGLKWVDRIIEKHFDS